MKVRLHSEAGVPEYWIADLDRECVWAHTDPRNGTYRLVRELHRSESITPQLLRDCHIGVDSLLA